MVTARQLVQGTQKVNPKALERAPDGSNSPLLVFEVQKIKALNSLVVCTQQKKSGRWPKGKRPSSREGVYKQVMRFSLESGTDLNKQKPRISRDKCSINCGCFTGDTKVILTDGTTASFKELLNREFSIYSLDENNKVVISDAVQCELKERNAKLVKITLDNDYSIKCTLDHKFRLKNGEYKEAKDLLEGDSLAALYRRYSGQYKQDTLNGYEMVRGPENSWVYSHILADDYNERFNILERLEYESDESNFSRHHIDFNKKNNNPNNIERMGFKEHIEYHSKNAKRNFEVNGNPMHNPESVRKMVETQKSIGHYDKASKRMKSNNPMFSSEISQKVTNTKKKQGDYENLDLARSNSLIHKKRNNLKNWINSLEGSTVIINKEICEKLGYFNISCLGVALRSLIKETEYQDKIILNKKARNKPIELTVTDGTNNHKVKKIEFLDEKEDVYCLSAPEYSNFAIVADDNESLNSGVFVHNCDNYYYMWWWGNRKVKANEGKNYPSYKPVGGGDAGQVVNPQNIPGMCKHLIYVLQELKRKRLIQ